MVLRLLIGKLLRKTTNIINIPYLILALFSKNMPVLLLFINPKRLNMQKKKFQTGNSYGTTTLNLKSIFTIKFRFLHLKKKN